MEARLNQSLKMNKEYKAGIKDLPFLLLFIDLVWWVLSLFEIYILQNWWIGELLSHSVAFVLFMAFYAYIHRYCLYSWICIISLGLLNITNIFHYFINFEYIQVYAGLIILSGLIFALIRWKNQYSQKF